MQYAQTLPLADREVVLTFDDGPLPHNSNQILEILASQCVKATFFEIGRMARASPEGVRKLRDAGHTIGTHTQNHPLSMNHMLIERARQEIDDGIASVRAALGDSADTSLAPFFRIPGLLRADNVEAYLASQDIQIWSADFLADDWHRISASRVYDLALRRLEAKGKGILLLHDIQARTVAALPRILNELKARGYHIVHVVPATPDRPATPTRPEQWLVHPPPDDPLIAHWPKVPNFEYADLGELSAPGFSDIDLFATRPLTPAESDRRLQPMTPWQRPSVVLPETTAALPAPAENLFEMPAGLGLALHHSGISRRRAEQAASMNTREARAKLRSADVRDSLRSTRGKLRLQHGSATEPGRGSSELATRISQPEASAYPAPPRLMVQIKKKGSV
jgi:peptidoglycan/xylan/chitin deacetylase (PgdA/CDA1 family)